MRSSVTHSLLAVALLSDIVAIRGINSGRSINSQLSKDKRTDNTFGPVQTIDPPAIGNVDQRSTRTMRWDPSRYELTTSTPRANSKAPTNSLFSRFGGPPTRDFVQNSAREGIASFVLILGDDGNACQVSDDGQCISTDDDSGLNQWYPITGGCVFRITSEASISTIGSFDISDDVLLIDYSSSNDDTISMTFTGTTGPANSEVKKDTLLIFEMSGSIFPPGTGFTICIDSITQAPSVSPTQRQSLVPSQRPTTHVLSMFPSVAPSVIPTIELPRFFLISGDDGHDCQVSNDGECISSDSDNARYGEGYIPLFSCTFGITQSAEVSTVGSFEIADDSLIVDHVASGESIELKEPIDGFSSLSLTKDTTITFRMKNKTYLALGFTICIDKTSVTPSESPNYAPTFSYSAPPSIALSLNPSAVTSVTPSKITSTRPSIRPTSLPLWPPSVTPTSMSSSMPSNEPSTSPTLLPPNPSSKQTGVPSLITSNSYTPTNYLSDAPTSSDAPTTVPSSFPTKTRVPTFRPSSVPTHSVSQSIEPSNFPSATQAPFSTPSESPTRSASPSHVPTSHPTISVETSQIPSTSYSVAPTFWPTQSSAPSSKPSAIASSLPTTIHSSVPTVSPSSGPTATSIASSKPSWQPTESSVPTSLPSIQPSGSTLPTGRPSLSPSRQPSVTPSTLPSFQPSHFCEQNFFRDGLIDSGTEVSIDIDSSGTQSAGDAFVFDNTVQRASMDAGSVSGWCKFLRDDDTSYCAMTFRLPEGMLFTQGIFSSMSILAGTECYADQKIIGAISGSNKRTTKSFTYDQVGFIPNWSCDDIYVDTWTATGFDDFVDADLSGDISPGDSYLLYDEIFESVELSNHTGKLSGECTILQDNSFDKRYCFLTASFEGGSISFQGPFHSMLITGGTGCFAKMSGMLSGSPDVSSPSVMSYKFLALHQQSEFCKRNRFRENWIETGSDIFIDRNKDNRDSSGDVFVFNHIVRTSGNGRAGSASGLCMYLENILFDTYCHINFNFEEGSIAVQGFFHKLAIVASSGCFSGASGLISGRVSVDHFEYNFDTTSLYGNENLDDLSPGNGDENSENCFPRDVPNLVGTWIGRDTSTKVDTNGDDRTSSGDILVFEDSETRNIDNPFISGKLSGRCTVLLNSETRITDEYYCVTTFAPENGIAVFSGDLRMMSVVGATGCYTDISAIIQGTMYDEVSAYTLTLDEPSTDSTTCIPDSEFSDTWQQFTAFRYISYGDRGNMAKPGDKLLVNDKVYTPGGIQGQVKGECIFLPKAVRNEEFCTLSFEFSSATISVIGQFKSMVITGGSGCYHGIRGTVTGSHVQNGAQYSFVLDKDNSTDLCTTIGRFDNRLTESGPDTFFDADLSGAPSTGDSFLFDNHPVLTSNFTDGIAAGVCHLLGPSMHAYCTSVYSFDEGSIVTAGYFEYMTIVGGTGCYSGVNGQFRGRDEEARSFSYEVTLFL